MVISTPVQRGVLVLRVSTQLMVVHRWWHHCSTIQHGSSQLLVVRMQGGVVALQHNTPLNKSSLIYSHHNWSCLCKQLITEGRKREQKEGHQCVRAVWSTSLFRDPDVLFHLCSLVSCLSFRLNLTINLYGMVWYCIKVMLEHFWSLLDFLFTFSSTKVEFGIFWSKWWRYSHLRVVTGSPAVCLEGITVLSTCCEEGTAAGLSLSRVSRWSLKEHFIP